MKKLFSIILGVVVGAFTIQLAVGQAQELIIKDIVKPDIVRTEVLTYADGRIERLSPVEYVAKKQILQTEFANNKAEGRKYDFDINKRDLVQAVMNKELQRVGKVELNGITSKEEIRVYMLGLLGITP